MLLRLKQDLRFNVVILNKRIPVQESHLRRRQRRSYGKYLKHLSSFYNIIKSFQEHCIKKILFKFANNMHIIRFAGIIHIRVSIPKPVVFGS